MKVSHNINIIKKEVQAVFSLYALLLLHYKVAITSISTFPPLGKLATSTALLAG